MMARAARPAAETVAETLAAMPEATVAQIAPRTGLSVSTVGKALVGFEVRGRVARTPGGRGDGRRQPDRWTAPGPVAATDAEPAVPATAATEPDPVARSPRRREDRLRHGELAGLVLDQLHATTGRPVTASGLAAALNRSAGEVAMVGEAPRRYVVGG